MAQAKGITRAEEAPQQAPKQGNMGLLMVKMLLKNPSMLIKLRRMGPDEERYIAPPRPYELPEYRKGMKVLHLERAVLLGRRGGVTLVSPWLSRWHTSWAPMSCLTGSSPRRRTGG